MQNRKSALAFRRMKKTKHCLLDWRMSVLLSVSILFFATTINAGSWSGIEPLKSRRADVLRIFGQPIHESRNGSLTFKVAGGTVSIFFVDAKFVNAKKLNPQTEGTVLQIILQHETSSDTPESMSLPKNREFVRVEDQGVVVFRNLKEGVVYSFVDGKLKTTRYTFSESQISHARK